MARWAPLGSYSASKFAHEALTEVLGQEVKAFNIRVALIEPGVFRTAIFEKRQEPPATIYPQGRRIGALLRKLAEGPGLRRTLSQNRSVRSSTVIAGDSATLSAPMPLPSSTGGLK